MGKVPVVWTAIVANENLERFVKFESSRTNFAKVPLSEQEKFLMATGDAQPAGRMPCFLKNRNKLLEPLRSVSGHRATRPPKRPSAHMWRERE